MEVVVGVVYVVESEKVVVDNVVYTVVLVYLVGEGDVGGKGWEHSSHTHLSISDIYGFLAYRISIFGQALRP